MDILSYYIPCTFFPRMNYAQRNSLAIYNSYNAFISDFVMQKNEVVTYDHVSLHICKAQTDRNFPIEINDIVRQEDSLTFEKNALNSVKNINAFLNQQPKQMSTVSIIFLDVCYLDEISGRQNDSFLFVLLSRSPSDIREAKTDNLIFSTKDCVRSDVCNLLEKVILKPMKEMCEFLYKVRNSFTTSQPYSGNGARRSIVYNTRANATKDHKNCPAKTEPNESLCNKNQENRNARKMLTRYQGAATCHHLMNRRNRKEEKYSKAKQRTVECFDTDEQDNMKKTAKKRTVECLDMVEQNNMKKTAKKRTVECLDMVEQNNMKKTAKKRTVECLYSVEQNNMKKKYRNDGHLQKFAFTDSSFLESVDKATVERLLQSMLALYGMSNIQENERPHIPKYDTKELSDELCRNLFKINRSVKGVGYRSSTLQVFLSEKDVYKEMELRKKIEKVLSVHDIVDFEIVQVSEDVQYLMHVGAKLEPVPGYGTLGCFAEMDGVTKCILLSKHVANACGEIYFEEKKKVCSILKDTLQHEDGDLDIAAAEIYPNEEICNSKFKDSTGIELKGSLHEYCGKDKLFTEEQKVHFWGASSKPGKGVITIPKVVFKVGKCSQTLVEIKDGDTKFAEGGDRGAVVCTDDPDERFVYVLGMVMGEVLTNKGENGRRYYVLPLSDGLKQLARKTGKRFELI
ncbi:uncharacterized protein LOC123540497 [Mercenaria mercenaria]|uniref:uncharacterized protein LOC123540497 n=1 Tax=Mercenaria mercenaria TaxID=6596 RepID=UPI00234E5A7A|nr:uncharacterized protein LOC123540497 [Mercenaria mercenaria]